MAYRLPDILKHLLPCTTAILKHEKGRSARGTGIVWTLTIGADPLDDAAKTEDVLTRQTDALVHQEIVAERLHADRAVGLGVVCQGQGFEFTDKFVGCLLCGC